MVQTAETPWTPLEFKNSDLKVKTRIRGREYEFFVSPYNIPQAIRAFPTDDKKAVRLELRYLVEDEELLKKALSKFLSYEIGKFSKRLYAITIATDSPIFEHHAGRPPQVRLNELTTALKNIGADKDNSSLVREAVKDHRTSVAPPPVSNAA